jgi:hypothetical protein
VTKLLTERFIQLDPDPGLLPDPETVRDEALRRIVASFVPE